MSQQQNKTKFQQLEKKEAITFKTLYNSRISCRIIYRALAFVSPAFQHVNIQPKLIKILHSSTFDIISFCTIYNPLGVSMNKIRKKIKGVIFYKVLE